MVLASETTVSAAHNPPEFEPLGAYQLRGRGQPLAVFRLRAS
jgi:class 3 adenylate cyclase